MAVYPIIIAPNPILNQVSKPVMVVDDEVRKIVDDMKESLNAASGAGLAAIQIGIPKRILILDISSYVPENKGLYVMINPEITYISDDTWEAKEGCLSFPIERIPTTRPENIKVKFLDYNGNEQHLQASGWFARGIQHEMDHLNGITLLEHVPSKLKKDIYLRKLLKYKKFNSIK